MNVYQLIAVVSAGLAVAAGGWDAYRVRNMQRYSAAGLAVGAGGPILSLVLYLLVTNLALKQVVTVALLVAGGAAGLYVARSATLTEVDGSGQVRLSGVSWLPLPAALCVGAIQIFGAVDSLTGMIIALAALEAAVGFGIAAAVTIVYRRSSMVRPPSATPGPQEPRPPQPQTAAG